MALGTAGQTITTAANFIPELWSDEVIAGYKSNLVLGNLVTKINHSGKKGDTINIHELLGMNWLKCCIHKLNH